MAVIVGIDLGTTTSIISFLKNGKPEVISNIEGQRLTESAVSVDKYGNVVIGDIAKRDFNGLREIKREMGTTEKVELNGKIYTPEEISAEILKKLKRDAEDYIGEEIEEAVITVPAMFNASQKAATKKAGELAGFKVERVIAEPVAAALAYGMENLDKKYKMLVYDFGGGTFDVSILDFQDGILDVLATEGNNYLGGKDLDGIILNYVLKESSHNKILTKEEKHAMLLEAEKLKKDLSTLPVSGFTYFKNNINVELNKNKYEELISKKIDETFEYVEKALRTANLTKEEIDVVLTVGGSTRTPIIKKRLKQMFGNKVKNFMNPQEVVSMGAAIQGGIKSGEIEPGGGIIVTDIITYSMGIAVQESRNGKKIDGVFSEIIKKGSYIPCREKEVYSTASDNQTSVKISVYQGENEFVKDNQLIGQYSLTGILPKTKGLEKIEVTFDFDINSVLTVETKILSTEEKKIYVYNIGGTISTGEAKASGDTNGGDPTKSKYYSQYKVIMEIAEKKSKTASESDKNKVENLISQMKQALIDENSDKLEELDEKLTDLILMF